MMGIHSNTMGATAVFFKLSDVVKQVLNLLIVQNCAKL